MGWPGICSLKNSKILSETDMGKTIEIAKTDWHWKIIFPMKCCACKHKSFANKPFSMRCATCVGGKHSRPGCPGSNPTGSTG